MCLKGAFPKAGVCSQTTVRELPVVMDRKTGRIEMVKVLTIEGRSYALVERLAKAIYGCVQRAVVLEATAEALVATETEVAIKCVDKAKARDCPSTEDPLEELDAIQYISSNVGADAKNILVQTDCGEDDATIYSVTPFCAGGELFDLVPPDEGLGEKQARKYFRDIVNGVATLHRNDVAHRDLSLENVMINSEGEAICIDLGMCGHVMRDAHGRLLLSPPVGPFGKINYQAPEVLAGDQEYQPFSIDVWALGIILYVMLTGIPPLEQATDDDPCFQCLKQGKLAAMTEHWGKHLSEEAMDLLDWMIQADWRDRPTLEQVLEHPWVRMADSEEEEEEEDSKLPEHPEPMPHSDTAYTSGSDSSVSVTGDEGRASDLDSLDAVQAQLEQIMT